MTFEHFALQMYPNWIAGIAVMAYLVIQGKKEILRISKKPIMKWFAFLGFLTILRIILHQIAPISSPAVLAIPWQVPFTVFWEDAIFGVPLLLFKQSIGDSRWRKWAFWPMVALFQIVFGLGHMYQGVLPAILLSFYVPYTLKMGEKHGFGTVMICHMAYDLATILFLRSIV